MEQKFKESDKESVIEFLNFVANHARFTMSTNEIIKYYQLLSYMQKDLLPKIDSNIFEIKRIIENDSEKDT